MRRHLFGIRDLHQAVSLEGAEVNEIPNSQCDRHATDQRLGGGRGIENSSRLHFRGIDLRYSKALDAWPAATFRTIAAPAFNPSHKKLTVFFPSQIIGQKIDLYRPDDLRCVRSYFKIWRAENSLM